MNEEFNDPRLVAVYDQLNPWGEAEAFYLSLVGQAPQTILDLGCGTGRLARAFARLRHTVIGVDPAPASLAHAARQPDGDLVDWQVGDARTCSFSRSFDLVTMTNHVFQFLPLEDIGRAMANIAHHLAPAGRLAFESRNPQARAWERWTPERSFRRDEIAGLGPVESWVEVNQKEVNRLRFTIHFHFIAGKETLTTSSWLYFPDLTYIKDRLSQTGLELQALFGDWDGSPMTPQSPEIIVVAGSGH